MITKLLQAIGRFAACRTWILFGIIMLLTLFFGSLSSRIRMNMNMNVLLPEEEPIVKEYNLILEEFEGAANIMVTAQGEPDNLIAYVEHVVPLIDDFENWIETQSSGHVRKQHEEVLSNVEKGLTKPKPDGYFRRVDYKIPPDFMENHGLMLMKPKDMENSRDLFLKPGLVEFLTNLNNSLEKEYIQSEEKISTTQREQQAVQFLDGIELFSLALEKGIFGDNPDQQAGEAVNAITLGSPYIFSPERDLLLFMVIPNFNAMEMDWIQPAVNGLEELLEQEASAFNVSVGLTGSITLQRDEMDAIMEDSMTLTIIAIIAVLLLFMVSFRMVSAPVLAVINLLIGVVWAMGLSYLMVGILNMFTAMMSIILIGLGIDFSVHIISIYTELRNLGVKAEEAIVSTLEKVGKGIITGGLTTAAAFLTLMIGRSRAFTEFGLVCGTGLIMIMISTLVTLPTLLMVQNKIWIRRKKEHRISRDITYGFIGATAEKISLHRLFSIPAFILVTAFFIWQTTRLKMDYNYLNMEPEGLKSVSLQDTLIEKFNMSMDMANITATSLEENEKLTEKAREANSVSFVESLTDYIPPDDEQTIRAEEAREIREIMKNEPSEGFLNSEDFNVFLEELYRLEMNIIEMQDMAFVGGQDLVDRKAIRLVGHPERPESEGCLTRLISRLEDHSDFPETLIPFSRTFRREYRNRIISMANPEHITLDMLPLMIRDKYVNRDENLFLITIYPKGNIWDMKNLQNFTRELQEISPRISGMPPLMDRLMEIMGADGRRAVSLTLTVVFFLLLLDFRSIRYALLAMAPMVIGIFWMTGIMGLFGLDINLMNIIAIPLIVGIGIDDGVHLLHRWHVEKDIRHVFASTGKAVTITSLTTMLSFGSLVFATYRGFGSFGLALFIGTGMCLLASILILPAFIKREL